MKPNHFLLTFILLTFILTLLAISTSFSQIRERETTPAPAKTTPSPEKTAPARASVNVIWEGSSTVNIVIDGSSYAFRGGQEQRLSLKPNSTLELYIQVPGKKLYAEEFLLIDASGGELRVDLEGEKAVFSYETPSEKQQREQRAAEARAAAERRAAEERAAAERRAAEERAAAERKAEEERAAAVSRAAEDPVKRRQITNLEASMVMVSGGTFAMGCTEEEQGVNCYGEERPSHSVTLSTFSISKYEVTQSQWQAVMGNNPSGFSGCDQCPVVQVSWDDVQEFLTRLNAITGKNYRLPTEAEWEYTARGGSKSKGYRYSGSNKIDRVSWYDNKTHPVGQKAPNELGLYDMSGNVSEWCYDWYGDYSSSPQTNPRGPSSGSGRVFRGGGWPYFAGLARLSLRGSISPDIRISLLGVRLAL